MGSFSPSILLLLPNWVTQTELDGVAHTELDSLSDEPRKMFDKESSRNHLAKLEKKKFTDKKAVIEMEFYQFKLAKSLLKEACLESVGFFYVYFTPTGSKFEEAEKIAVDLFRVNPWVFRLCNLVCKNSDLQGKNEC